MSEFPLPDTDLPDTREFWRGAARGELVIPRCASCNRYCWYPSKRCPGCEGEAMPWTAVSGRGTLFSWATVERALVKAFATKTPYVTGLVALEEDPAVRIVTNLVECDPTALRIDMPVCVVFRNLSFPDLEREVVAPMFKPAE